MAASCFKSLKPKCPHIPRDIIATNTFLEKVYANPFLRSNNDHPELLFFVRNCSVFSIVYFPKSSNTNTIMFSQYCIAINTARNVHPCYRQRQKKKERRPPEVPLYLFNSRYSLADWNTIPHKKAGFALLKNGLELLSFQKRKSVKG